MDTLKDKKIMIGIVGLGRSGWNIHGDAIKALSDKFQIVAVTDTNQNRSREIASEVNCTSHKNFRELVNNNSVEIIVIASPNNMHYSHSISAMEAGKDVICEKPMAYNCEEAKKMINTSKRTEKLLAIFQNKRFSADFQKVREIVNSGLLGRIVQIKTGSYKFSRRWDWQTLKEYGGGELRNNGPHHIDRALELFGHEEEPEIFCYRDKALTLGDAEDHLKVILYGKKQPFIEIEITSACAYKQDTWLVLGTHGTLHGDKNHLQWKWVNFSKLPKRYLDNKPTPDRSYNREELVFEEDFWKKNEEQPKESVLFYKNVFESYRKGTSLIVTPESVCRQIAVIEKCSKLCPI